MRVKSKRQMKRLQARGAFGNCVRQWDSLDDAVADGYRGPFYLRGNETMCSRKAFEVDLKTARSLVRPTDTIYEAPPNEWRVVQGEIMRGVDGLYWHASTAQMPLRTALIEYGVIRTGLDALCDLRRLLCPSSVDEVFDLLDDYDGHIVEFTEFDRPIGTHHRHLLVWEVRDY